MDGAARLEFFARAVCFPVFVGPRVFLPCVLVEGVEALELCGFVILVEGFGEWSEAVVSEPLGVGCPVGWVEPADGGVVINDGGRSVLPYPLNDVTEGCVRVA